MALVSMGMAVFIIVLVIIGHILSLSRRYITLACYPPGVRSNAQRCCWISLIGTWMSRRFCHRP
jgi:hypothetical protein